MENNSENQKTGHELVHFYKLIGYHREQWKSLIKTMNKATGIDRIIKAFFYSCAGLKWTIKNEAAFRQELIGVVILVPIAWVINIPVIASLLLTVITATVLITELLNSAIEALADRISDEIHPLLGAAKDIGSAAVLVHIAIAAFCWFMVLISY